MMFKTILSTFLVVLITISNVSDATAQKPATAKKYPSLMWEISGNGLTKKSYLFGTMHVSSKLAFNLSDSFYNAIFAVDAIALENDPGTWQQDYIDSWFNRIGELGTSIQGRISNDFITKSMFQFSYSDVDLKSALASDPEIINHFLYRNFIGNADFEENTYLDMHIYQCAKKLNKQFFGLEDFRESERIMIQAYKAQAGESKRKSRSNDTDEEDINRYQGNTEKIQDAYRKGNLDMLDSLSKKDMHSEAFYEYFLYKRNEIHANEIGKLLQKKLSVFAAVGAMHLAGNRGVIELLKAQGYKLRPIFMGIQMSKKREEINKIKIPKAFETVSVEDSLFTVKLPGKLYNFSYSGIGLNNQWVHADFANGAYYMITRVATQGNLWDYDMARMQLKIDSLLYENIPGKILEKKQILKNGYKGFDIINKTRKGDVQRYHIFITPLELLVFKMSGYEDYVQGNEGNNFFNSINLKQLTTKWQNFTPDYGGFTVQLPSIPIVSNGNKNGDEAVNSYLNMMLNRGNSKSYEAIDKNTGTYFLVQPKNISNYDMLEEDSFNLALCQESFLSTPVFFPPTKRLQKKEQNVSFLETQGVCSDGDNYTNRIYATGTNFYLLVSKYKKDASASKRFLESFKPTPYTYKLENTFTDSILGFTVKSALCPDSLSTTFLEISRLAKKVNEEEYKTSKTVEDYERDEEKFLFRNDTTNEEIVVLSKPYAKYTYVKDSLSFWQDLEEKLNVEPLKEDYLDYYVKEKSVDFSNNKTQVKLILADTNSSQTIYVQYILNQARLYTIYTLASLNQPLSPAKQAFFNSFTPLNDSTTNFSIYTPKGTLFFSDYNSKDSAKSKFAKEYISSVKFIEADIPLIQHAIQNLDAKSKDYFTNKTNLIEELGYLNKSDEAASVLMDIYNKTADTATFQNKCIEALSKLKTQTAFTHLSGILSNDPPVFEDAEQSSNLFNNLSDTLLLAKTMLPNLLPLASIDDFKWEVLNLISSLLDSNLIKPTEYESLFSKLYFDAKREQKKMLTSDEKLANKKLNDNEDDNAEVTDYLNIYRRNIYNQTSYKGYKTKSKSYVNTSNLATYSRLLLPFWDKYASVQNYLNRNLQFNKASTKFFTAKLLHKNGKLQQDSIFTNVARDDNERLQVYEYLLENKKIDLFPKVYKTQIAMATLLLKEYNDYDSLQYLDVFLPASLKLKEGNVYFFKYKEREKDVDWKIAFCGFQPKNEEELSLDKSFCEYTEKVLKANIPLKEQLIKILNEKIYSQRKSSSRFFDKSSSYSHYLGKY